MDKTDFRMGIFVDEFNVFVDEVNRQITAKMLVRYSGLQNETDLTLPIRQMDTARSSQGKQYILITPLSLNPRIIEPWVTVQQMADPERRQPVA